ncbi:MAG: IS630 family transposase, partial [Pseudomonadota bacterium]|nr:IS630 family transposase [Pseudomonadota bacterium]MEE2951459.1 IS630 family transposase [Pseudomonadota bacterium]
VELQEAINHFVDEYNVNNPKPFNWRADPDEIIAARSRGFQALESDH